MVMQGVGCVPRTGINCIYTPRYQYHNLVFKARKRIRKLSTPSHPKRRARLVAQGSSSSSDAPRPYFVGVGIIAVIAAAATALGPHLQICTNLIDPLILSATTAASIKLLLICVGVGWLLRSGKIPNSTGTVLSQVSFSIFIPCMLFSKVSSTLASNPPTALLLTLIISAVGQIMIGAIFGKVLAPFVDGSYSTSRRIFGWHPLNPPPSAQAIATGTALATGIPSAAGALLPRTKKGPAHKGLKELAKVCCAFGNSFTLPLVFIMTLLPAALAERAIGYCALFLLAWSPCLWSMGLSLIQGNGASEASPAGFSLEYARSVLVKTANPPVLSILFGVFVGLTPLRGMLFDPPTAATSSGLGSLVGQALHSVGEVITLMGEGTLGVQTLVLASSLLQKAPSLTPPSTPPEFGGGRSTLPLTTANGIVVSSPTFLQSIREMLLPVDLLEIRFLAVVSLVRFLLLPLATIALLEMALHLGWLGAAALDPILLFVVLIQSVMPSAQNLIIILQINEQTRSRAPTFAKLLLKLYALAIVPLTLWVTFFASRLQLF